MPIIRDPHRAMLLLVLMAATCASFATAADPEKKKENPAVTKVFVQLVNLERKTPLSADVVDLIEARCAEAVKKTRGALDQERYDAIIAAMPNLIESVKNRFDSTRIEGASYWVAYAIGEAVSRADISPKEAQAIASNHNAVIDKIAGEIRTQILNNVPADQKQAMQPEIERKLTLMKAATIKSVQALRDDCLFPALKDEISDKELNSLLERFKNLRLYPGYVDPQDVRITKDEDFLKSFDTKLPHLQENLVFYMIVEPLTPKLLHNEYWGPMNFQIGNAENSKWPIAVSLTPRRVNSDKH